MLRLEEQPTAGPVVGDEHPLDPLNAAEITRTAAVLREHFKLGDELRFETIELAEPAKEVVRRHVRGAPIERVARFTVYRRGHRGVWTGRVDLRLGRVAGVEALPEARPMISPEEFLLIETAAKADPRFQAALARRGIDRLDLVCVDPWSAGNFGVPGEENRRLAHTFVWMRLFELDNYYAHPVEGINVVVDVDTLEVLRVDDHAGADPVPVPPTPVNYDCALLTDYRKPSAPLDVVQPAGPGFTVEGNKVTWENWDFRVGFNGREGLVLQSLGYTLGARRRPILYRASLAEMVVPYGTPDEPHYRKNVFDSGEYGFGKLANSLSLGCDCLGHIHYFDVCLPDLLGNPRRIENAICLHEEDAGLAWKHFDFRSERTEVRRLRRLVLSSITTVGNYEYASYWYLYQDGRIEFEMKATGIINTAACMPGTPQTYGTEVAPGLVGHNHQHVFCARLDMEVDGPGNTVVECDTVAPPLGPGNPMGNAFHVVETPLATELAARRCVDFSRMRYWKVINPTVTNRVGKPTAYKLETQSAVQAFTHPDGPSGRRAGFIHNHLWVTPFSAEERFPAGEFMNHSTGEDGLPAWTAQDRPVANADIVLWHSFGLHHMPRPEDHPVQPCVFCGFKLMPLGFFDQNPVIDLPPDVNRASRSTAGACCHHA
ncbi:primary-amine oxidase [Labrys wisconsinensis]|uniref:Amine oxidase n=1 Tax=Labrys wisconsinensis TaxID=425677 RepID=A0ABU0J2E1_9HYPH|nr:primary-amine oxidase [Labrys wisconsinensis]MDQ0467489.1 primary-amine oxidase [Labrys wisconsinensis]